MASINHKNVAPHERQSPDTIAGKLLIAMPNMTDPRFEHAVILMIAHDPDHAMGVVVNKSLDDVDMAELIEQLGITPRATFDNQLVRFGGPVQTNRGMVIHSLDYCIDTTIPIGPDLGVTSTKEILVDIASEAPERMPPRRYLMAIGYAGWGAGQLEDELSSNAWLHAEADEELVFEGECIDVWRKALSRLGVTEAMFSPEWSSTRAPDKPLN